MTLLKITSTSNNSEVNLKCYRLLQTSLRVVISCILKVFNKLFLPNTMQNSKLTVNETQLNIIEQLLKGVTKLDPKDGVRHRVRIDPITFQDMGQVYALLSQIQEVK